MTTNSAEIRIGEVRVVRTFRLNSRGGLYPLATSGKAWTDGDNTAMCSVRHEVPSPRCGCGFYGYGALSMLRAEYPQTGDVTAVVSLWGRLVPARLGARAKYARINAIWLSRRVPASTVAAVAARYPHAAMFRQRDAMLAEFPLSDLPSYRLWLWRFRYAVPAHVLTSVAAMLVLVLVGRRAIEPGGSLNDTTFVQMLDRALTQSLFLMMAVLGYILLAHRHRVPRLRRPAFGRWFGAPLLLGLGNVVLASATNVWALAVAWVCALLALIILVADLVPWVRFERAIPAALVRYLRVVVGERDLSRVNTMLVGGMLLAVGPLLPAGGVLVGFLFGYLGILVVILSFRR